jgi:hypothetical protein
MLQLALLLMSNDKYKDKEGSVWCIRKKVDPSTSSTNWVATQFSPGLAAHTLSL